MAAKPAKSISLHLKLSEPQRRAIKSHAASQGIALGEFCLRAVMRALPNELRGGIETQPETDPAPAPAALQQDPNVDDILASIEQEPLGDPA